MKSVFIVEDEILLAKDLKRSLEGMGYKVSGALSSGEEAIRSMELERPDIILMDISLSGSMDGIEAAEQIRARWDIPIIYLTAYTEGDVVERAKKTEPYGYLGKPVSLSELRSNVETALYKHEADKRVRASEARMAKAEHMANLHAWDWDLRTGKICASPESYITFGINAEEVELNYDNFIRFVHPEDRKMVEEDLKLALEGLKPYDLEFRIIRPNGEERYLHYKGELVKDPIGKPLKMEGMALDITDRKKANEQLRQSREMLSLALESANMGIWDWDLTTGKAIWSEGAYRLLGGEPGEFESNLKNWKHRIQADDWPFVSDILNEHLRGEREIYEAEYRILNKNEEWQWVHARGKVTKRSVDGTPLRMHGVIQDIDTQRKAEETSKKNQEQLNAIFKAIPDCVFLKDKDLRYIQVNSAFDNLFGLTTPEIIGKTDEDLLGESVAVHNKEIDHRVLNGESIEEEATFSFQGEQTTLNVVLAPVLGTDDRVTGICGVARNVTERKKTEKALIESEERLRHQFEYSPISQWLEDFSQVKEFIDSLKDSGVSNIRDYFQRNPSALKECASLVKILEVNHATCQMYSADSKEQLLQDLSLILCDESAEALIAQIEAIDTGLSYFGIETVSRTLKGESLNLLMKWSVLPGFESNYSKVLLSFVDITSLKKTQHSLKESERRFKSLFDQAPDEVYIHDHNGNFLEVNKTALIALGYSREELLNLSVRDIDPDADMRGDKSKYWQNPPATFEARHINKEGRNYPVEIRLGHIEYQGGSGILAIARDISERREAENEIRRAKELLDKTFKSQRDGIFILDNSIPAQVIDVNPMVTEIFGYSRDELVGRTIDLLHVDSTALEDFQSRLFPAINKEGYLHLPEFRMKRKNGVIFHTEHSVTPLEDEIGERIGWVSVVRDITERKFAEDKIKHSLEEKEVLLREIHHRVKNNLSIISSLLHLQSQFAGDHFHEGLFKECQERIRSMSLFHEMLYRSESLKAITASDYIGRLTGQLESTYGLIGREVSLKTEIADVSLRPEKAIPLGFVLTELLSNCYKHAFTERTSGEILVKLDKINDDEIQLVVKDNGIGIPNRVEIENAKSLGIGLIDTFVDQLEGCVEIIRDAGTEVRITFKGA